MRYRRCFPAEAKQFPIEVAKQVLGIVPQVLERKPGTQERIFILRVRYIAFPGEPGELLFPAASHGFNERRVGVACKKQKGRGFSVLSPQEKGGKIGREQQGARR